MTYIFKIMSISTEENPDQYQQSRLPVKVKDSDSGQSGSGTALSGSGSDSSDSGDSDSESESDSSASETSKGVKKTRALQIRNLSSRSTGKINVVCYIGSECSDTNRNIKRSVYCRYGMVVQVYCPLPESHVSP